VFGATSRTDQVTGTSLGAGELDDRLSDPGARPIVGQVRPSQPAELGTTQTGEGGDFVECGQAVAADVLEESGRFVRLPNHEVVVVAPIRNRVHAAQGWVQRQQLSTHGNGQGSPHSAAVAVRTPEVERPGRLRVGHVGDVSEQMPDDRPAPNAQRRHRQIR